MIVLSVEDLIATLRQEVDITNSAAGLTDQGLLDMTDEQIETLLKLGASRLDVDADNLQEALDDGNSYPILLLAKIELFTTLATLKADLVDMNADNNNRLSLGQRWQHYNSLAENAQSAFDKWNEDNDGSSGGTGGVITSYNVILDSRMYTTRNYNEQKAPKVKLRIHHVDTTYAELEWAVSNISHFGLYRLYIGTSPVFDIYLDGGLSQDHITENARLIKTTLDIHDNHARIKNLTEGTTYFVAVVSVEKNGVYGYSQKSFTTLEETED